MLKPPLNVLNPLESFALGLGKCCASNIGLTEIGRLLHGPNLEQQPHNKDMRQNVWR